MIIVFLKFLFNGKIIDWKTRKIINHGLKNNVKYKYRLMENIYICIWNRKLYIYNMNCVL